MNLDQYKPCDLEIWINEKYQWNGIWNPSDLDLERVASAFGVDLVLHSGPSFAVWQDNQYYVVFLNQDQPTELIREAFFHELCHPLRHSGCHNNTPEILEQLQEIQAGLFQLYAALPFYLIVRYEDYLHNTNAIPLIAYEFQLPIGVVKRRFDQIVSRIHKSEQEQLIYDSIPRRPETIISHSPETLKVLNKLLWISAQKGRKVYRG